MLYAVFVLLAESAWVVILVAPTCDPPIEEKSNAGGMGARGYLFFEDFTNVIYSRGEHFYGLDGAAGYPLLRRPS